jgi:L-aminopeptidase/D-esterase-like protein
LKNNNTNSNTIITNKTNKNGRALIFDWNKFFIGSAEYPDGPTGCIVFYFPDRNVNAVVDIKGGAAASILTNDLSNGGVCMLDAIVLAGGSTLGLEAATGVAASIFKDRNYACGWGNMPFVSGSVIFDWVNRNNHLYPDKNLGSAAYENAEPGKFLLGRCGAGINARIAKVFGMKHSSAGGQGGAVKTFGNIRIAVFTVINALGAVYDEIGNMLHGYVDHKANIPVSETDLLFRMTPFNNSSKKNNLKGNTTLTVVITNANLNLYEMQLIARQMHNSFSEVIRPFGTAEDGDTLYFVSTKEVTIFKKDRYTLLPHVGILATKVIKEAIYSAFD